MMGIKRVVDTSFWTDGKVDEFSPEDKYFMLYLLTNPFTTQLGIYELSVKQAAFQLGYSIDSVRVLIERFESKYGIIYYSETTNEIALKNFLRHSIIKGGAPVRDCLIKELKKVKDKNLILRVFNHIKGDNLNETVKNIISDYEEKNGSLNYSNEKQNDNENDNDNEVSYPVSYHDTYNDTYNESFPESEKPKKAEKPRKTEKREKRKHGEYTHVLLSESEYEKLASDFGADMRDKAITFLDEYIEEKGYKSKSHNLAIRRWVIDAVREKEAAAAKAQPKQRYGDFDVDKAFEAAVIRSYAQKPEPETAATNETIRKRAEALQKQLT